MEHTMNFAVVGAGGFARFAVQQFVKRPNVRLVAVFDNDAKAIAQLQSEHPQVKAHASLEQLLADPAIALVYIASPPALHHEQSLAALRAGKHVICEKPAAIELNQAEELRDVAQANGLLFVVNLSGGIFIEHGVHFFDMFEGWLGAGQVVAAQKLARPAHPGIWDICQCTVVYPHNAPVHFFHGFNQPKVLDRQDMRLQFERGEVKAGRRNQQENLPVREFSVIHAKQKPHNQGRARDCGQNNQQRDADDHAQTVPQ